MTLSSHLTEDQRDALFPTTGSLSHASRDKEMKNPDFFWGQGWGRLIIALVFY